MKRCRAGSSIAPGASEKFEQLKTEGNFLEKIDVDIVRLEAVDSIEETKSNQQWSKKVQTELERLNKDCNLTAGLEAVLYLAERARVMLRRNINTKSGLVNNSLGMV